MIDRFERAQFLITVRRYADAERELHYVLSQQPENATALALLGYCKVKTDHLDDGITLIQQAISIRPDEDNFYYFLARAHIQANHIQSATDAITEALKLVPDNAGYIALYANTYVAQANWPRALVEANRALALNPENLMALACRAMALFRLEKYDESETTIRTALKLAPGNHLFHDMLAKSQFRDGDISAAFDSFRESLRLDPTQEGTKESLVTTVKARYWLYRQYLKYLRLRNGPDTTNEEKVMINIFFVIIALVLFLTAMPGESIPDIWKAIVLLIITPLAIIFITEPIANLIISFHPRWKHSLDENARWLTWVTSAGLLIAIIGLISLAVPPIIFGLGIIALAGSLYEGINIEKITRIALIMLLGIASFLAPYLFYADGRLMINLFGVAVIVFRWFTDARSTSYSH